VQRSGVLHIEGMESRLDHILLARQGSSNPVGEATKFLEVTCKVDDGDNVTIEGISDKIGRDDVIYVRNAWRIEPAPNGSAVEPLPEVASIVPPATTKSAPTPKKAAVTKKAVAKKPAPKKVAPKKVVPKRSGKKRAPKKAVPKRSGANKLRFKNNKAQTSRRGKTGRK
jgi:hypothetical protein